MNRLTGELVKTNLPLSLGAAEILKEARLIFSNTAGFTIDQALAEWAINHDLKGNLAKRASTEMIEKLDKPVVEVENTGGEPESIARVIERSLAEVASGALGKRGA